MRFLYSENYLKEPVIFKMPTITEKRLPVLSIEEINRIIEGCKTKRDKALVLFLIDSGLRRAELCNLNWGDIDISSGLLGLKGAKEVNPGV